MGKVEQKIQEIQAKSQKGILSYQDSMILDNLQTKFTIMQSKLAQAKDEARQTGAKINEALNGKKASIFDTLGKLVGSFKKTGNSAENDLKNKISSGFENVGKKLDGFRKKMSRMIGTAMVFSLIRNGLNNLRNGLINMLKADNAFSNSLAQIKGNLLTAFMPIYNAVLPAINTLMNALSKITATIAQFTAGLFGTSVKKTSKQAKSISKSLNGVASAGEEASGSLASFDKLEVVGGSNGSSGGGTTGGGSDDYDFTAAGEGSQKLLDYLNKIKELIGDGKWFDAGEAIGKSLSDALEKVDVKAFFEKGKEIAKNIANGINGFITGFDFSVLGNKISDAVRGAFQTATTFVSSIDWQLVGTKIVDFIKGIDWGGIVLDIFNLMSVTIPRALMDLMIGICDGIINALKDPNFMEKVEESGMNLLEGLINGFLSVFDKIGELFNKIIELFKELFGIHSPSTLFSDFGKMIIEGLANGIKSMINFVVDLFKNAFNQVSSFVTNIIQSVINFINTLPSKISNALTTIPEKFRQAFQKAKDKVSQIWKSVTSIFSRGGKIFNGLKEGIADTFKSIVNTLIDGINKVIKIPFEKINKLLNKIRNIEILGVEPFSDLWSKNPLPVPSIPKLAKGTVIPPRQEFAAILGDQKHGTNIEAPLDTIKQANREVLGEFFNQINSMSDEEREIVLKNFTIVAKFGERNFQKLVVDSIRLEEKEQGKPLLVS